MLHHPVFPVIPLGTLWLASISQATVSELSPSRELEKERGKGSDALFEG